MSSFLVREATAADAPGLRRLFAKAFGKELIQEEWQWKFDRNPDGWFGVVAEADGEVVGNYAGWGMRLLIAGEPRLVYAVGDVATDPTLRALGGLRGIYRAMVERFYESVGRRDIPFCFGFPNARALQISNRIARSRTIFPIRELRVRCDAFPSPPAGVVAGDFVGEAFEPLWAAASRYLSEGAMRDRARANWRFHARPTRYYRMVSLRGEGGLQSWAALSVLGEEAIVADYLGRQADGGDLPALFAAAASEAKSLGASTLLFWETPGGPGRRVLDRLAGERREAGFVLAARIFDEEAARLFFEKGHLTPALYDVT